MEARVPAVGAGLGGEALDELSDARRVRGHFTGLLAGEIANKIFRFGAAVVMARALSVHDYGLLNVGIAIAGIAVVATTLGLPDQAARDLAVAEPTRIRWITGRVVSARFITTGSVAAIGVIATALISPSSAGFAALIGAMALATASGADWLLRGLERMQWLGLANALGGAIVLVGSIVVAVAAPDLAPALAVMAVGEFVLAAVCWIAAGRRGDPILGLRGIGNLMHRAWPLAISSVALYLYLANFDTIILAAASSTEDAGLYSGAYRLFLAANTVSVFAAMAFLPVFAAGIDSGREAAVARTLRRTLSYLLAYGLAAVAVSILAGETILGGLFGSSFESMDDVLIILTIALCWYVIGYPTGYTLIARERNKPLLAGAIAAATVNVGLCIVLIPPFGPIGAAVATASSCAVASLIWIRLHRDIFGSELPIIAVLVTVSAVTASGIVLDAIRIPIAIGLLIAAAAVTRNALIATGRSNDEPSH